MEARQDENIAHPNTEYFATLTTCGGVAVGLIYRL